MNSLEEKCVDYLVSLIRIYRADVCAGRIVCQSKKLVDENVDEIFKPLVFQAKRTARLGLIVNYIQNDNDKYNIAFNDFEAFSNAVELFSLSPEEKMEFVFWLCTKNAKLLELGEESPIYDSSKIIDFRINDLDDVELDKFFMLGIIPNMVVNALKLQTNYSQEDKVSNQGRKFLLTDQKVLLNSKIVQEHYLDKIDSYTVEDVGKIMDALEGLGICDMLLKKIKKTLLAGVYKRLSKQASIEKREKDICGLSEEFGYEFSKKVHRVDPKERDRIYQEVEEAIDLRDMTFKEDRYVSVGEQIQWVSKLLKLSINRQMIEKFLHNIDFTNQWCMPSYFSFYLNNRGKLVYFKDKYCLGEKIRELDDYFYEMKTASELGDEADCQFWEKELIEGTKDALSWIPKNFEYEFVSGEKLYKENRVGNPVKILGRNNIGIGKK